MLKHLLIAGSLVASASMSQAENLRFATLHAPGSPTEEGAQKFAELVEEYTGGDVTIQVYPSGQLGNANSTTGAVKTGAIAMAEGTFPLLADIVPEYNVYNAGYFYESWPNLKAIVEGEEFGRKWNEELLEKSGMRLIAAVYYGSRNITTNGLALKTPADLAGKKIRSVPNPMSLAVVTGLGGKPTPVDFADLFQALSQGVVDGQENPLPTIEANNFYEVQDHLILTHHQLIVLPWIVNERVFQSLTEDQREAILRAAKEAGEWTSQRTREAEGTLVATLAEHGMTVIGEDDGLDIDAFRDSVRAEVRKRFEGKVWDKELSRQVLEASRKAE